MSEATLAAIRIRLLCAIINGEIMQCDSQSLINASNDIFCCVPKGLMPAVELFLLCQIASGSIGIPGAPANFDAQITTTDGTVTTIYQFAPPDNTLVRIEARALGYAGAALANNSQGKIATFKVVGGVITQIGGTTTVGTAEENAATDLTFDTSGNLIRVRVTGIGPATTINWRASGQIFYES